MSAAPRLGSVVLKVTDVERAFAFYRGLFGFAEVPGVSSRPRFGALAAGGGAMLLLQGAGEEATRGDSPELGFAVDDPEALAARVGELGGTVVARNRMGRGRSVDVRDPDGHALTLYARTASG